MAEFNANELSEYIEERIKSNAISSAVDFVVECFKYKKLKNKKVEILYTYTDITTIIEDSEKGKSTIVREICFDCGINKEDVSRRMEKWDKLGNIDDIILK